MKKTTQLGVFVVEDDGTIKMIGARPDAGKLHDELKSTAPAGTTYFLQEVTTLEDEAPAESETDQPGTPEMFATGKGKRKKTGGE